MPRDFVDQSTGVRILDENPDHFHRIRQKAAALTKEDSLWGPEEIAEWRSFAEKDGKKRDYKAEILDPLKSALSQDENAELFTMDTVSAADPGRPGGEHEVVGIRSSTWRNDLPRILISTEHGYEPSGDRAIVEFFRSGLAAKYAPYFNIAAIGSAVPWAYEYDQRWAANGEDPNRAYHRDDTGRVPEIDAAMDWTDGLGPASTTQANGRFSLHETTYRDDEFRQLKALRDGEKPSQEEFHVCDGYYLVGKKDNPAGFEDAIIDGVDQLDGSYIASDEEMLRTGLSVADERRGTTHSEPAGTGVKYDGTNGAGTTYRMTTEVSAPKEKLDPNQAVREQLASMVAGMNYMLAERGIDAPVTIGDINSMQFNYGY